MAKKFENRNAKNLQQVQWLTGKQLMK